MISAIKKRRSVRDYLNEAVSDEQLHEIVMAAFYAPSAHHRYPWDLVIVKDRQSIERLSKVTPWAAHAVKAPVVIAVVGHAKDSADWVEDCAIAAEHIWLEAAEQGLSSCWIQIRGNDEAEKETKKILNAPEDHLILCLMPIGRAISQPAEHQKEEFDKSRVKQEKY